MLWEKLEGDELAKAARNANGTFQVMASFLALLPAAAFVKDKRGRLIYLNERAQVMWKVKAKDAIGKTIAQLFDNRSLAESITRMDRRVMREQSACVIGDLSTMPHSFTLVFPMIDAEGDQLLGGVVVQTHG